LERDLFRRPVSILAILGTAIAFGEWRSLLAFGFLTVAFLFKLRREECFMSGSFPNDIRAIVRRYRRSSPSSEAPIGPAA
jgi:protein-S-isoprenylcysteine O-methyltransferase Ste14